MSTRDKRYIPLAIAILAAVATPAFGQRRSQAEAIENGWMFNYGQAKRVAREANKPLMVVFRCVP